MIGGKIAILGVAAEGPTLVDVDDVYPVWFARHACLAALYARTGACMEQQAAAQRLPHCWSVYKY